MTIRSSQMYRPLRTVKEAGFPGEYHRSFMWGSKKIFESGPKTTGFLFLKYKNHSYILIRNFRAYY